MRIEEEKIQIFSLTACAMIKNHTYSHIEIFLLTIKRLFEKITYTNIQ